MRKTLSTLILLLLAFTLSGCGDLKPLPKYENFGTVILNPSPNRTVSANAATPAFTCIATGEDGVPHEFRYPRTGESSSFESPEKTVRIELDHSGNGIDLTTWFREKNTEKYRKTLWPFHYVEGQKISYLYAYRFDFDDVSGLREQDPWSFECGQIDLSNPPIRENGRPDTIASH